MTTRLTTLSVPAHRCASREATAGFTLIEVVMVIVVMSILGVASSVFISGPVRAYFDTVRRNMLADTADTALRRFSRDIEGAVPNSIRTTTSAGVTYIELIPTVSAAHYRSTKDPGNTTLAALDFTSTSGNTFEIVGPYDAPPAGAQAVIFNLGQSITNADAYAGGNRRTINSVASNVLTYALGSGQFPFASPSDRFYVVNGAVTYVCDPTAKTFTRYSGYAIQATQPNSTASAPLSTATKGVLAANTVCTVTLTQTYQSRSLVAVNFTMSSSGESVSYYGEIHVPNVP